MKTEQISRELTKLGIKADEISFRHFNRDNKMFWNFEIKAGKQRKNEIKKLIKHLKID